MPDITYHQQVSKEMKMVLSRNFKSLMATLTILLLLAGVPGLFAQSGTANRNDMYAVVDSNNQFAIDLYRKISAQDTGKNIFVSPFSVSTALAMTFEGSSGNTRKQMAGVLHLDMSDADRSEEHTSELQSRQYLVCR